MISLEEIRAWHKDGRRLLPSFRRSCGTTHDLLVLPLTDVKNLLSIQIRRPVAQTASTPNR